MQDGYVFTLMPLVGDAQTQFHSSPALPGTWQHLPVYSITGAWGTAIFQVMRINGFTLVDYRIHIEADVSLFFQTSATSGVLHYCLSGSFRTSPDQASTEPATLPLGADQYCLGLHTAGVPLLLEFSPGHYHHVHLCFSEHLLMHIRNSLPEDWQEGTPGKTLLFPPLPISARCRRALQTLMSIQSLEISSILYLNQRTLHLLSIFINDFWADQQKAHWRNFKRIPMAELGSFITHHLDKDQKSRLSPAYLARRTGTSLHQFRVLFYQHYRMSLSRYILQIRMNKAMELIKSGEPAGMIFQQLGYVNFSSFTRAFTTYYGFPPTRFK